MEFLRSFSSANQAQVLTQCIAVQPQGTLPTQVGQAVMSDALPALGNEPSPTPSQRVVTNYDIARRAAAGRIARYETISFKY